jgi:hypothetical protein
MDARGVGQTLAGTTGSTCGKSAAIVGPQNNKMQLTRSGHSRWRPSQLILVFAAFSWG